jgi:hypothetical protein
MHMQVVTDRRESPRPDDHARTPERLPSNVALREDYGRHGNPKVLHGSRSFPHVVESWKRQGTFVKIDPEQAMQVVDPTSWLVADIGVSSSSGVHGEAHRIASDPSSIFPLGRQMSYKGVSMMERKLYGPINVSPNPHGYPLDPRSPSGVYSPIAAEVAQLQERLRASEVRAAMELAAVEKRERALSAHCHALEVQLQDLHLQVQTMSPVKEPGTPQANDGGQKRSSNVAETRATADGSSHPATSSSRRPSMQAATNPVGERRLEDQKLSAGLTCPLMQIHGDETAVSSGASSSQASMIERVREDVKRTVFKEDPRVQDIFREEKKLSIASTDSDLINDEVPLVENRGGTNFGFDQDKRTSDDDTQARIDAALVQIKKHLDIEKDSQTGLRTSSAGQLNRASTGLPQNQTPTVVESRIVQPGPDADLKYRPASEQYARGGEVTNNSTTPWVDLTVSNSTSNTQEDAQAPAEESKNGSDAWWETWGKQLAKDAGTPNGQTGGTKPGTFAASSYSNGGANESGGNMHTARENLRGSISSRSARVAPNAHVPPHNNNIRVTPGVTTSGRAPGTSSNGSSIDRTQGSGGQTTSASQRQGNQSDQLVEGSKIAPTSQYPSRFEALAQRSPPRAAASGPSRFEQLHRPDSDNSRFQSPGHQQQQQQQQRVESHNGQSSHVDERPLNAHAVIRQLSPPRGDATGKRDERAAGAGGWQVHGVGIDAAYNKADANMSKTANAQAAAGGIYGVRTESNAAGTPNLQRLDSAGARSGHSNNSTYSNNGSIYGLRTESNASHTSSGSHTPYGSNMVSRAYMASIERRHVDGGPSTGNSQDTYGSEQRTPRSGSISSTYDRSAFDQTPSSTLEQRRVGSDLYHTNQSQVAGQQSAGAGVWGTPRSDHAYQQEVMDKCMYVCGM